MTTCRYCRDGGADPELMAHSKCWSEFGRRRDEGTCVKCGVEDASGDGWSETCGSCGKLSEYRGYPPKDGPES